MIKPWQIIFLAVVAFLAVIFFIHHAKPKQKNYKSIFSTENYLEYGYTPDNYKEFYIEPPSVDSIFRNNKSKLNDIVNKFSPIYIFHSDERFYPASYGTLKNFCSLYKTVKPYNSEQIPTQTLLVEKPLTIKNMIDYTPKNFWDNNTVFMQDSDYSLVFTPSDNNYGNTQESQKTQLYNNIIEAYSYIVGDLNNPYFEVKDKTSFHLGSPGCPADWSNNLGVSCDKLATDILNANSKINWEPSPLFCYVVSKQIFQNGKPVKWVNNNWSIVSKDSDAEYVTDFIYQADFGFDGSISVIPGLETHTGDRTTVAVRFLTKDLQTNLDNAKPFRIYLGCHSGYSWYTPDKMLFRNINSDISYGRDTKDASHVIVYCGRESHELFRNSGEQIRISNIANDLTGGGVCWQPPALYVETPQDWKSHLAKLVALSSITMPDSQKELFKNIASKSRLSKLVTFSEITPVSPATSTRVPIPAATSTNAPSAQDLATLKYISDNYKYINFTIPSENINFLYTDIDFLGVTSNNKSIFDLNKYVNSVFFGHGLPWIYFGGRRTPLSSEKKAFTELLEGSCINTPNFCKYLAGSPSSNKYTYSDDNLALPICDNRQFDTKTYTYKPSVEKCFNIRSKPDLSSCQIESGKKPRVWAITELIVTKDAARFPMTGIANANENRSFRWKYIGANVGTTPVSNLTAQDTNKGIGGDTLFLLAKYEEVDTDSAIPVLTQLTASHFPSQRSTCPGSEIPRIQGVRGDVPLIAGNPGTRGSCWYIGSCIKYTPINQVTDFISSVMLSFRDFVGANRNTSVTYDDCDNISVTINLNQIEQEQDMHRACGDGQFMYIVYGKNSIFYNQNISFAPLNTYLNYKISPVKILIADGNGEIKLRRQTQNLKFCGDDNGISIFCGKNQSCSSSNVCFTPNKREFLNLTGIYGQKILSNLISTINDVIYNILETGSVSSFSTINTTTFNKKIIEFKYNRYSGRVNLYLNYLFRAKILNNTVYKNLLFGSDLNLGRAASIIVSPMEGIVAPTSIVVPQKTEPFTVQIISTTTTKITLRLKLEHITFKFFVTYMLTEGEIRGEYIMILRNLFADIVLDIRLPAVSDKTNSSNYIPDVSSILPLGKLFNNSFMYFNFFSNAGKIYKDNRYQDFNFFTDYNPTAPGSSVYTQPLKENIGYGINPQAVLLPTDVTNNFGISFEILFNGRIKYADTMYFKFLLNTYVKDSNNMLFAVFNWQRKSNVGWVTVNAPNLGATNINDKIKEAMAETITEILYDKLKTSDEYVNLIINNTLVSKL